MAITAPTPPTPDRAGCVPPAPLLPHGGADSGPAEAGAPAGLMSAPTRPAGERFPGIVREARAVLPGARLRRRLVWRCTLVWRSP
ncbi:hypothetical protein GCM10027072_24180 [Streptomyces bullii]